MSHCAVCMCCRHLLHWLTVVSSTVVVSDVQVFDREAAEPVVYRGRGRRRVPVVGRHCVPAERRGRRRLPALWLRGRRLRRSTTVAVSSSRPTAHRSNVLEDNLKNVQVCLLVVWSGVWAVASRFSIKRQQSHWPPPCARSGPLLWASSKVVVTVVVALYCSSIK